MPKNKRSKKLKARWRRTDISEITDAKMKETDDMLSGGSISSRPDSLLFIIDKGARFLSPEEKKEMARTKPTKLEELLQPNPNVRPTLPGAGSLKRKKPSIIQNTKQAKKRRKIAQTKVNTSSDSVTSIESEFFDIWTEKPKRETDVLSTKPLVKTKTIPKPNSLPAVEIPHEGTSYRPPEEAHQELLTLAIKEQLEKRKQLEIVMEQLKGVNEPRKKQTETEVDEVEELEGNTSAHMNVSHIPRKTRTQRNKEKRKMRAKRLIAKRKHKELQKKINIDKIVKDVMREELQHETERAEIQKKTAQREVNRVKRLGPEKFEQPDILVALTEDIAHSLKNHKALSNPLLDRFTSLQKRNIIEARSQKNYHRRYLLKAKFKRHVREFTENQEKKYASIEYGTGSNA